MDEESSGRGNKPVDGSSPTGAACRQQTTPPWWVILGAVVCLPGVMWLLRLPPWPESTARVSGVLACVTVWGFVVGRYRLPVLAAFVILGLAWVVWGVDGHVTLAWRLAWGSAMVVAPHVGYVLGRLVRERSIADGT